MQSIKQSLLYGYLYFVQNVTFITKIQNLPKKRIILSVRIKHLSNNVEILNMAEVAGDFDSGRPPASRLYTGAERPNHWRLPIPHDLCLDDVVVIDPGDERVELPTAPSAADIDPFASAENQTEHAPN
jgi:hypothetical protein